MATVVTWQRQLQTLGLVVVPDKDRPVFLHKWKAQWLGRVVGWVEFHCHMRYPGHSTLIGQVAGLIGMPLSEPVPVHLPIHRVY